MKRIFLNTSWLLFEKIIRIMVNLLIVGKIASTLGVHNFGILSYCQAIIFVIAPLFSLGIDQVIRNKISYLNNEKCLDVLLIGLQIKILSSISMTILFGIIMFFLLNKYYALTFYLMVGLVFRSFGIIDYYFDNRLKSWVAVNIRIISFLIVNACYICAINSNASVEIYALISSIEFVIIAAIYIILYGANIIKFKLFYSWKLFIEIIKLSFPILICDISGSIFFRINQIVLENLLSPEELGLYTTALRFTEVWYFIPSSILISFYPSISSSYKDLKIIYNKNIVRLFEFMIIISIIIVIFNFLCAAQIINLFYGKDYITSYKILIILSFSNIFIFFGMVQELIDVSFNLVYWRLFRLTSGVIITLISSYLLIKLYGINGAAWSIVIGFMWTYFLSNIINRKIWSVFVMQIESLMFLQTISEVKKVYRKLKYL